MTLRVDTVPDPPAGQDWSYLVPGKYLEQITAVQGRLTTAGGLPTVAHDASGNGNDGTYLNPQPVTPFLPGLVTGDDAVSINDSSGTNTVQAVTTPVAPITPGGDLTIVMLWENVNPFPTTSYGFVASAAGGLGNDAQWQWIDNGVSRISLTGTGYSWQSANNPFPHDNLPHQLAIIVRNGVDVRFYLDGIDKGNGAMIGVPIIGTFLQAGLEGDGVTAFAGAGTCDEWALWNSALAPADIAALNAARVDFATYSAAILALSPQVYYHLDDPGGGNQRTPALAVSQGTELVALLSDGFNATPGVSVTDYSWIVKLSDNTETNGNTIVSAGAPPLLLPGGYQLATITPDIQPGDQWSNVTVWWDDAVMDSLAEYNPYRYPPGAFLVYRQQGASS